MGHVQGQLIAPAAGYSIRRYLLAMALGRLPPFWLLAAIGAWWQPGARLLFGIAAGTTALMFGVLLWRRLRLRNVHPVRPHGREVLHVALAHRAGC